MNKLALKLNDIEAACAVIATAPTQRAVQDVARARRTLTPGRHRQACLSAGRTAIAEVLFAQYPTLGHRIGNLTKAIRLGMGEGVKFDELNLLGAKALGLL